MRSLFFDVLRTVNKTIERSTFSISKVLRVLGLSRFWYYSRLSPDAILDGRFNLYAIDNEDERLIVGYRLSHHKMNLRELAYAMIGEDCAYLSPSSIYRF